MNTDALIEKDYLLQLKEGPISKFIKYYENIISDDEKSKLSAKEGKGIIIHVQGFSIVLDNNEIDEQDFNEYKEIYELVDDDYKFDESKKPPKIPETPASAAETPAVAAETPASNIKTIKKKKPSKNKTKKKKKKGGKKKKRKNKKKKKNKKKSQRGGMEKGLKDDLTQALFGVSSKKLSDMTSGRAVGNTEGQKTGEDGTSQPTARILANTVVDDNYYTNKPLKKPSVQDFVSKERKPSSISLATGLRDDPFGLKQQRAPPLVVHDIPIGHAHFRAPRDRSNRKKTKREIANLKSNTLQTCDDLQKREERIENLAKKTRKMGESAAEFAKAMKDLRKQQEEQKCVISGGKKSRRKKKKNKKKKNQKKSTRKKRRK